jgi:hypothetical protein
MKGAYSQERARNQLLYVSKTDKTAPWSWDPYTKYTINKNIISNLQKKAIQNNDLHNTHKPKWADIR